VPSKALRSANSVKADVSQHLAASWDV